MVDIAQLINQDLIIAEKYLEAKKFDRINVIGNRILQNLFVTDEKQFMVVGLIVKEISTNLHFAKAVDNDKRKVDECISFAKDCLENMKLSSSETNSIAKIWDSYSDFQNKIREYLLDSSERDLYQPDEAFTSKAAFDYLEILVTNKNLLLDRNINPLTRTREELITLIHTHGGKYAILSYLFIKAFEHVYKFALHGKVSDEELSFLVLTNIDYLKELSNLYQNGDEEKFLLYENGVIGDLMYFYRKYFMMYGELKGEFADEIPLSPKASDKIRKIIQESNK